MGITNMPPLTVKSRLAYLSRRIEELEEELLALHRERNELKDGLWFLTFKEDDLLL